MFSPLSRRAHALLIAGALLCGACRASGAFLIFGGPSAPQQDLIARVKSSAKELDGAHADFAEAFRLYQRLTAPQAVELEALSEDYADAIETCAERAKDLAQRIDSVRAEKETLIQGWSAELPGYSSDTMRQKSAAQMQDTEARAQRVLTALEHVRERMQPVLLELQDYGLFFHHNLNARAIATLEDTYKHFDAEFKALEGEFAKAQAECAAFLANFVAVKPAPAAAQTTSP
jgi:chromosome segregation ATPase